MGNGHHMGGGRGGSTLVQCAKLRKASNSHRANSERQLSFLELSCNGLLVMRKSSVLVMGFWAAGEAASSIDRAIPPRGA